MSEQINKVLASTAQAFTTAEQLQARTNIDAQQSITFNYSGSNITALNGSAIAQSGALTEVVHDANLSGSGTSASPLGLNSEITLSSTGLPYINTINSYSMYMHNASATSYVGLGTNYFKDSAGGELYIHSDHITINDAGDLSVSIHPTGIFIDEHNGGDEDLTIGNRSIVFSERDYDSQVVDRSSIERWNSYSAGLFTGLDHDYNLSGLGTTTSLLGLADPVRFSASGTAVDSLVSSVSVGNKGFSANVPSAWTADLTYNRGKFSYEWLSALDTADHEGLTSHTMFTPGNVNLSSHNCSYIKHNYVDIDVDNGLRMFHGYGSGSDQSGLFARVSGYSNGPTIQFQQGTANEYVDIPSIRRWNGYSAGVSAGNGLSGSGTSGSPLGMANPSIISSNSHSSYRSDNFVMVTANDGDRSYLNEYVLEFQHNGTSYSVTTGSITDWNNKLFKSAIECDDNSAVTAIGGSAIGGGDSWKESSNVLSTGYGGTQVTAGSQYPEGAGNWAARTVKGSGIPDFTMYGFQTIPTASTATMFLIGKAGTFLEPPPSTYNVKVYKPTTAPIYLSTGDYPVMSNTADGVYVIVNLGSGPYVTYADGIGATASIPQYNSAQLIWDSDAQKWVKWNQ